MINIIKNKTLIKNFIMFSALLIVIVVTLSGLFYNAIVNYSQTEISKSYVGKLKMYGQIDEIIKNSIREIVTTLSTDAQANKDYISLINSKDLNSNLKKPIFKTSDLEKNTIDTILSVKSNLADLQIRNDIIQSSYVYLSDLDAVISSRDGIVKTSDFNDTNWIEKNKHIMKGTFFSFWLDTRLPLNQQILDDISFGKIIYGDKIKLKGHTDYVITYVYPLSINNTFVNGSLLINIDQGKYSALLNSSDRDEEGTLFKINSQGIVLNHPEKNLVCKNISNESYIEEILKSPKNEGSVVHNTNGKKILFTYYKPYNSELIYIGQYSLGDIISKTDALRNYVFIGSFTALILITLIAFYVSNKMFSPVLSLIKKVKKYSKESEVSQGELLMLESVFEKLIRDNSFLSSEIVKNEKNQLNLLVNNAINSRPIENYTKVFPYNYFLCITIEIDKQKEFKEMFKKEQSYYMRKLILNLAEQVIGKVFTTYATIIRTEKIVIIVNMEKNKVENFAQLKERLLELQAEVRKVMPFSISAGVGCVYEDIKNVPFSFNESIISLNRKFILSYEQVIFFVQKYSIKQNYRYPLSIEKEIMSCLLNSTTLSLRKNISDFKDFIINIPFISFENAQLILNQLLSKIIEYMLNEDLFSSDIFGQHANLYIYMSEFETIDDVEIWLVSIIEKIVQHVNERKYKDKSSLEKAIHFIELNYHLDIDVNSVAKNLEISYTQLRRIFKENTNDTIVNFINKIRIEKSKKILTSTNKTLLEISSELGYNNDQSFSRYFKKFENMTPGEYRTKYKQ